MLSFVWQELLAALVSQDLKVQKIIGALKVVPKSPEVPAVLRGKGGRVLLQVHCLGETKFLIQNSCTKATFPIGHVCLKPLLLLVQIVLFQKMRLARE